MTAIYKVNWLSLKNNWFRFKTSGKLPVHVEEFTEYSPSKKEKEKDVSIQSVVSTDNVQKSSQTLLPSQMSPSFFNTKPFQK